MKRYKYDETLDCLDKELAVAEIERVAKRNAKDTLPWMSGIVKDVNVDRQNEMVVFSVENENSLNKEVIEFRTSKTGNWFLNAYEQFGGKRFQVYNREDRYFETCVIVPLKIGDYLKFQYEKGEYANWIMFPPTEWIRNEISEAFGEMKQ